MLKFIVPFIILMLFLFLSSTYLLYASLRKNTFNTETLIDRIFINLFLGFVMSTSGYILINILFLFFR